eukprot:TRINITY_DN2576_c0_g1_i4.p2 TRINITY_DN2576_c0_g1~~TRINITY_DN2576_c0_g1_i4.p2  ORF type:complete len:103 (+),score=49.61 TRINITY_DN2576_c0_g1_i4:217-525(+)
MLCELSAFGNFFSTWMALTLLGLTSITFFSFILFHFYYVNCTFEKWQYKSNPKFPQADKVREEIIQMLKGPVSYTHLRAHETPEHLVCRLLLEKKKKKNNKL